MRITSFWTGMNSKPVKARAKLWLAVPVLAVFLLSLSPVIAVSSPAPTGETGRRKVIMVIVDRISVDDVTNKKYENINKLISLGGLSLMTVGTAGDYTDINSYVSLGGGDKFIGSALAGESYNREEILPDGSNAYQAYRRNTGKDPGDSRVLNISVAATLKVNQKRYTGATPGRLGTVLHQSGLKTAVIGNSDLSPDRPANRLAVTIAMDDLGVVDDGNVSRNLLVKDSQSPYGWRTDYTKLEAELDRVWNSADLIVVETGDTLRVNEISGEIMKRMIEIHRDRAMKGVDKFIGRLIPLVSKDTMVMLVSPLPYAQAFREGARLTPLVIAGGEIAPDSILTSPTTRQKGLVANLDVAATVAAHLKVSETDGIIGLPVQAIKVGGQTPAGYVTDMYDWLAAASHQRWRILYYFTRYQWIVYSLVLLQLVFRYYHRIELARFLLVAIMLYPLAILLAPLAGLQNPTLAVILSLVLAAGITYLLTRIKDDLELYIVIAVVTVVPVVIDIITGGQLIKRAALGYDLIIGGRFYGIGNEYMGIIIGAAILGCAALLQQYHQSKKKLLPFIGLLFAGLTVFFASPSLGTNAGGALTAAGGFTVAMYKFTGRNFTRRSWLLLAAVLAAGVGVLAAFNYFWASGVQSHIGRAIANLFSGNILVIWQTIQRKLLANFYLLRHSAFSNILLLQFLLLLVLYLRNRTCVDQLYARMPYLKAGAAGLLIGALAAFAFNDSGVIAAALLLNYLFVPALLQVLRIGAAPGSH